MLETPMKHSLLVKGYEFMQIFHLTWYFLNRKNLRVFARVTFKKVQRQIKEVFQNG